MRAAAVSTSPSKAKQHGESAKPPSPIKIPPSSSRQAAGGAPRRSERLAIVASAVLVVLVALELATTDDAAQDVRVWSVWVVRLVFPSQQVTWIKIVCLILGFVLTSSYFLSSQAQLASAERLMIQSATVLVSPLKRKQAGFGDSRPATPSGTSAASWLASHCQSLLRMDHFTGTDGDESEELPQLKLRDECKASGHLPLPLSSCSEFFPVNSKQPIPFESEYLRGHMLFMVKDTTTSKPDGRAPSGNWSSLFGDKRRTLWVQFQGQFKKIPPPQCVMYLATELPSPSGFQVAFLTRQLVSLLITLVKKFVPTAHIAFGEVASNHEDAELPHAAFPLYQTVDEFVVTASTDASPVPSLGKEFLGETAEGRALRSSTPVGMEPAIRTDAVYSLQFHTMYADLAQWKIANVPGMPDMDLKRFCGSQPIRLAAYSVPVPSYDSVALCNLQHRAKDKNYLFCISMHHDAKLAGADQPSMARAADPVTRLADSPASPTSPCSLNRWRSVSCDQPDAVVRQQSREEDELRAQTSNSPATRPQPRIRASSSVRNMSSLERAENLVNLQFSLPLWIERVDAAAGNRKVSYLFVVEEKNATNSSEKTSQPKKRCVIRSAATVKNTLLLLDPSDMSDQSRVFRKMATESREFLYDTITRETDQVGQALQAIAAIPSGDASEVEKEKQAMLFNCLMSEAALPCIRSYQDIAVQLSKAKRDQMDIIFEKGVYRMLSPRFMRQEWFTLTTSELLFFRSFSIKPAKSIPLAHVLSVNEVNGVSFMQDNQAERLLPELEAMSPRQRVRDAAMRTSRNWYCVEVHVLDQVFTFFLDCEEDRAKCISSLQQLLKLKSTGGSGSAIGRLPATKSIDAVSTPVCCNSRKHLALSAFESSKRSYSPTQLAQDAVRYGLTLYTSPRSEVTATNVVRFLEAVELLSSLEWRAGTSPSQSEVGSPEPSIDFATDAERIAFALNVFHALYIHGWLLFEAASTHSQWKKLKTHLLYSVGQASRGQLRLSMAEIEACVLKSAIAPYDVPPSNKSAKSVPTTLVPSQHDYRVTFALQSNASKDTGCLIKVYDPATLQDQLQETCAAFLDKELVVDGEHRLIVLPKICEWMNEDLGMAVPVAPTGSRAFFCLQKLLPLMAPTQFDRVQHLLLGAGKECQIKYSPRFWTQEMPVVRLLPLQILDAVEPTRSQRDASGAKDDSSVPVASQDSSSGSGIPRSKSALQFLQSFFDGAS